MTGTKRNRSQAPSATPLNVRQQQQGGTRNEAWDENQDAWNANPITRRGRRRRGRRSQRQARGPNFLADFHGVNYDDNYDNNYDANYDANNDNAYDYNYDNNYDAGYDDNYGANEDLPVAPDEWDYNDPYATTPLDWDQRQQQRAEIEAWADSQAVVIDYATGYPSRRHRLRRRYISDPVIVDRDGDVVMGDCGGPDWVGWYWRYERQ